MTTQELPVATEADGACVTLAAANPFAALERRGVGKREWKNALREIIASEEADLLNLKGLRLRCRDEETQRLVGELNERKVVRVIELNKLLLYREPSEETCDEGETT